MSAAVTDRFVFFWDNFGPAHDERCEAVADAWPGADVVGLELSAVSETYGWITRDARTFRKVTIFDTQGPKPMLMMRILRLLRETHKLKPAKFFFSRYNHLETLIAAALLRICGQSVYVMNDSKFDDYPRTLWSEVVKAIFYAPYSGGLAASRRSLDYMRFLGFKPARLALGYDTFSLARIRQDADTLPAPAGMPFGERHFTIVARLVPKKNIHVAIRAFGSYVRMSAEPRTLRICGSGPLEGELRELAVREGCHERIQFEGFLQAHEIAEILGSTLALILPSIEEQFGFAVPEAQAMGIPVLVSDNCGARDAHVRSGVNGFVFEPDNPEGLAHFMGVLGTNRGLWEAFCKQATIYAEHAGVDNFVYGVSQLTKISPAK